MIPRQWSGIVIFDGECGICNAVREWAEARDHAGRLRFVAYQTADLDSLSPGLTRRMASRSVYFIYSDGRRVGRARAVFEMLRRLSGVWRSVGMVMVQLPFWPLAEPFYNLVARNRARLSARLGLSYCLVEGKPVRQDLRNKPSQQEPNDVKHVRAFNSLGTQCYR
jgi:predicted DCC family thiol-disulfide oxidoreductase YuxK